MELRGKASTESVRAPESLRVVLEADNAAPWRARRAVEALDDRLNARAIADLRAVVSELVAFYLSPADLGPLEIRLEVRGDGVRGEISPTGDGPTEIGGGGHGLQIIGALVEEWGIATDRAAAWFRLAASS